MSSKDTARMNIARSELSDLILPDLISIVIAYAMYSEEDKVRIVLANAIEKIQLGEFTTEIDELYEKAWMCVSYSYSSRNTTPTVRRENYNRKDGNRHILMIGFGSASDNYTIIGPVTIFELLPSNGLNITVPFKYMDILERCRSHYLKKMQCAIDQI